MPVRALDYSALTEPVSRAEVSAWKAAARADRAPWARLNAFSTVVSVIGIGFALALLGFGFLSTVFTEGIRGNVGGALLPFAFLVIVVLVIVAVVRGKIAGGGSWKDWVRLDRFAKSNGLEFSPEQRDPSYPGEIFGLGRNRVALEHLSSSTSGASGQHYLDLGNYRYVTGSGKSQTTHHWGFMAISLERAMPNIVLDSRRNNSLFGSNLPATLNRSQILHLEGDFDRSFTLYCPQQYERDALYIFTPDLMALLIDEASPFDVELVDRWMFVYSSKPFDMTDQTVLQRLFTIADTVGAKTLSQTARYADDRVGNRSINMVAPQGARLKRGVSVVGVVIFVAFALIWGWSFLSKAFGH